MKEAINITKRGPKARVSWPRGPKTSCFCSYQDASRSSVTTDKRQQHDTTPSTPTIVVADSPQLDVQTTPEPTTPTQPVNANGNNNQAVDARLNKDEFINSFGTPVSQAVESSSRSVDPSNMHTCYQRYPSEYHCTKDHPLEQVLGNKKKLIQTR
ncbi:hypothetical protein Tco_1103281 [Tanacetum coccineum]